MRRVALGIGVAILAVVVPVSHVLGIVLHLSAIYIAWLESGIGASVLTFFLPFVNEIYWIVEVSKRHGGEVYWYNMFALGCFAFAALFVLRGIGAGFVHAAARD